MVTAARSARPSNKRSTKAAPSNTRTKMVSPRISKLESRHGEVVRGILSGEPYERIATRFNASLDGVKQFAIRHQEEIDSLRQQANQAQADLWITDRRKTSIVLQRVVRQLDDRMPVAFGSDAAALAREVNRTIQTAYKVNDMWPKTTGVTVDNRTQTVNFLEATRLSADEVQELLGEADVIQGN